MPLIIGPRPKNLKVSEMVCNGYQRNEAYRRIIMNKNLFKKKWHHTRSFVNKLTRLLFFGESTLSPETASFFPLSARVVPGFQRHLFINDRKVTNNVNNNKKSLESTCAWEISLHPVTSSQKKNTSAGVGVNTVTSACGFVVISFPFVVLDVLFRLFVYLFIFQNYICQTSLL